jgi:hypothetical protein
MMSFIAGARASDISDHGCVSSETKSTSSYVTVCQAVVQGRISAAESTQGGSLSDVIWHTIGIGPLHFAIGFEQMETWQNVSAGKKKKAVAGRMATMQISAFPCPTFHEPLSDLLVPVKLGTHSVYESTLESWFLNRGNAVSSDSKPTHLAQST